MLSASTLLDSNMLGATIPLLRAGQEEEGADEPEDELEEEALVVGVGVAAAHVGPDMVLVSNVTVLAASPIIRPSTVAPVFNAVVPLSAKRFPLNAVVVSRVAELPILHQTLQASPPVMDDPGDVISVDTVLKIHTPDPVRLRLPVKEKLLVEQ
jgi:hypothetical protein